MLAEPSGTEGASVWPRTTVHKHMAFEITRSGKALLTQTALVWFFLDQVKGFASMKFDLISVYLTSFIMSHLMIIQIAAGCEPLSTNSTLMRLFSTMDSSVSVKAGAGTESFTALWANMRLLSCMGSDVSLEETRPVKCLSTYSAWEHCFLLGSSAWACPCWLR